MLVTPDVFEQGYERRELEFRMVTPVAARPVSGNRASHAGDRGEGNGEGSCHQRRKS